MELEGIALSITDRNKKIKVLNVAFYSELMAKDLSRFIKCSDKCEALSLE